MGVAINCWINTITYSYYSRSNCQIDIFTLHQTANSLYRSAKHSTVCTTANLKAFYFLAYINVRVFAIQNPYTLTYVLIFYSNAFIKKGYVFYSFTLFFYICEQPILKVLHMNFSWVGTRLKQVGEAWKWFTTALINSENDS
jgi:hypothetical protein